MPLVSIVIVNWNVRELLTNCLRSIFDYTQDIDYEVIVVDNASNDGSTKHFRENFNQQIQDGKLLILENTKNLGFSKANNQGFKEAQGEYVLFMNPDMQFKKNTVQIMLNEISNDKEIGIVTCKLLYGDNTLQPNVKNNPTFCSQLLIELKLHHLLKFKCLKNYLAKDFDYNKQNQVLQVMGAFIFTRKDLISQIGGWDEDYFIWWEDLDLCKKMQQLNKKIIYCPKTSVIHFEGKSFAQVASVAKQKRFLKGMLIYFKKHHNIFFYVALALFVPLSIFLAYIVQILKIKPKTQSKI